jgi:hypothetical protein
MSEKKISPRKRTAREPQDGSTSAAPQPYYGSPPMARQPQAPMYPPVYDYSYPQGSPSHLGRHATYPHPHGATSMPPGPMHHQIGEPLRAHSQQVTPESAAAFPYGSPPTSVKRRTFTGGTGTLSPLRSQRRPGEFFRG